VLHNILDIKVENSRKAKIEEYLVMIAKKLKLIQMFGDIIY